MTAGVLYLKSLLNQTGGDESAAIAAYYQGLGALRSRGVFDDTAQYVAERAGAEIALRRLSRLGRLVRHGIISWRTILANLGVVATTERTADLVFLLSQAAHALQTEMTAKLAELGVTPRMHCVLYHALGGEFTQIQLAEQCALDKTTMVVTMDALEKAGLAERRPSPTDRRARIIAVTERGRASWSREGDAIVDAALRRRARVAAGSDQRDAFVGGLQSLVDRPARRTRRPASSPCAAAADSPELDRLLIDHLLRFCL